MYRPRRLEYELVLSSVGLVLTEVRRQSNATNARKRYQATKLPSSQRFTPSWPQLPSANQANKHANKQTRETKPEVE